MGKKMQPQPDNPDLDQIYNIPMITIPTTLKLADIIQQYDAMEKGILQQQRLQNATKVVTANTKNIRYVIKNQVLKPGLQIVVYLHNSIIYDNKTDNGTLSIYQLLNWIEKCPSQFAIVMVNDFEHNVSEFYITMDNE